MLYRSPVQIVRRRGSVLLFLFLPILVAACAAQGMYVEKDRFAALYPVSPQSLQLLEAEAEQAKQLVQETRSAVAAAQTLKQAWKSRFSVLSSALDNAQSWGAVALAERWSNSDLAAASLCIDLEGGLNWLSEITMRQADRLIAWRRGLVLEAEALWAVRAADVEQKKISLYFEQIEVMPGQEPEKMRQYWVAAKAEAILDWARQRAANEKAAELFGVADKEVQGLRAALPADSPCPIFLTADPLLQGRSWTARNVELPDLRAPLPVPSVTIAP